MIAAIQSFNGGECASWMDVILAPCPRRDALLSRLKRPASDSDAIQPRQVGGDSGEQDALSDFDNDWVTLQAELARDAADVMRQEFHKRAKV